MNPKHTDPADVDRRVRNAQYAAMRQQQDAEVQRLNAPTWNELASAAGVDRANHRPWFEVDELKSRMYRAWSLSQMLLAMFEETADVHNYYYDNPDKQALVKRMKRRMMDLHRRREIIVDYIENLTAPEALDVEAKE